MELDPSAVAREEMPDTSETPMTDETTRDPVNAHGFEVQKRIGPTRLGVHKNWEWYDDPKRVMFSLSRYKFQMFGYWAAIWVHLNRVGKFKRPNPWKGLVTSARLSERP